MMLPRPTISVLSRSTAIGDDELAALVQAFQMQVSDDFAPHWGRDAQVVFVSSKSRPAPGTWWIAVLDNSDQAGALGYHDVTNEGLPIGKVFAGTDRQYGRSVGVTLSHEGLEMLADQSINVCHQRGSTLWAREVCDAVEADRDGYEKQGQMVSNFCLPSYYEDVPARKGRKYDFLGLLKFPGEIRPGGYAGVLDLSKSDGWTQVESKYGMSPAERVAARPVVGSRRERRRVGRDKWLVSTVSFAAPNP